MDPRMENQKEQTLYDIYRQHQSTRELMALVAEGDLNREFELMEQHGVMTDEKQDSGKQNKSA